MSKVLVIYYVSPEFLLEIMNIFCKTQFFYGLLDIED